MQQRFVRRTIQNLEVRLPLHAYSVWERKIGRFDAHPWEKFQNPDPNVNSGRPDPNILWIVFWPPLDGNTHGLTANDMYNQAAANAGPNWQDIPIAPQYFNRNWTWTTSNWSYYGLDFVQHLRVRIGDWDNMLSFWLHEVPEHQP